MLDDDIKRNIFNWVVDSYVAEALNLYHCDYKFIFVTGRPGAGKSYYIEEHSLRNSYMLIDSDEIILKINEIQNNLNREEQLKMAFRIRHELIESLTQKGMNIVFPTTIRLDLFEEYVNLVNKLGYEISIIHFNISVEEALNRCNQRYLTNIERYVPRQVIEREDYDKIEALYKNDPRINNMKVINAG